jgi:hypothetical protein
MSILNEFQKTIQEQHADLDIVFSGVIDNLEIEKNDDCLIFSTPCELTTLNVGQNYDLKISGKYIELNNVRLFMALDLKNKATRKLLLSVQNFINNKLKAW